MHDLHVRASIVINRPLAAVWNLAADLEQDSRWRAEVQSRRHLTPPPIGVGTRTLEQARVLGTALETTTELTAYVPQRTLGGQSVGALPAVAFVRSIAAVAGGTRVDYTMDADVSQVVVFWLLRPMLRVWLQGQLERNLRTLQQVLEAQGTSTPAAGE